MGREGRGHSRGGEVKGQGGGGEMRGTHVVPWAQAYLLNQSLSVSTRQLQLLSNSSSAFLLPPEMRRTKRKRRYKKMEEKRRDKRDRRVRRQRQD